MDSLDQCIVNACKNSWDKSYLAGTPNKDNCSGFVQSVAAELGVPMPRGNANAMVDGLGRAGPSSPPAPRPRRRRPRASW